MSPRATSRARGRLLGLRKVNRTRPVRSIGSATNTASNAEAGVAAGLGGRGDLARSLA